MAASTLQPEWAGEEPCLEVDAKQHFQALLSENPAESLLQRGYCLVKLSSDEIVAYARFAEALAAFCKLPLDEKAKFAKLENNTLMEDAKWTPNQFHGYSRMEGLKEQFMIRASGAGVDLRLPGSCAGSPHFGTYALTLYERLDQICRRCLVAVAGELQLPRSAVDHVLDPLNQISMQPHSVTVVSTSMGDRCTMDYMLPNYISSSILDVFHYHNTFDEKSGAKDKFHNNHASHTDSGILTVVPVADEPGLELVDQKIGKYIALEKIIHAAAEDHRQYATVFWGDSHIYLRKQTPPQACLHRVGKCSKERYSIVFKQRTLPITTAPRYQEDYVLSVLQLKAIDAAAAYKRRTFISAALALVLFGVGAAFTSWNPLLTS